MLQKITISIISELAGQRLDKALVVAVRGLAEGAGDERVKETLRGLSRAVLQRLLREGKVCLEGLFLAEKGEGGAPPHPDPLPIGARGKKEQDGIRKPFLPRGKREVRGRGEVITDPNHKVQEGEVYRIEIPAVVAAEPEAQAMALDIVYEDADLLVINKPAGMVVHPAAGNRDGTLVNALLAHCGKSLSGIGGVARPGIVHRLDKDTSGLMVVAKNDVAHQGLSGQFADRSLSRTYQSLVWGVLPCVEGEIEGPIGRHPKNRQKMAVVKRGGKEAKTFFVVEEVFGMIASLITCKLATGRTHQIRVHMSHEGFPVVGDPLYGKRRAGVKKAAGAKEGIVGILHDFPRQALHAAEISFLHPRTGKRMKFAAKMPKDMQDLLKCLRKMAG